MKLLLEKLNLLFDPVEFKLYNLHADIYPASGRLTTEDEEILLRIVAYDLSTSDVGSNARTTLIMPVTSASPLPNSISRDGATLLLLGLPMLERGRWVFTPGDHEEVVMANPHAILFVEVRLDVAELRVLRWTWT